jgi:carbon-monoxide dehydrogenase small subunit
MLMRCELARVNLSVEYSLQGALAQFSRSGIVQDLGRRLVADFAAKLNAAPRGEGAGPAVQRATQCRRFAVAMGPRPVAELDCPWSIQVI